jgi:ribosomal protein S12 methylthiotransferase
VLGLLTARGYTIQADPAQAEIILINTCGFIGPAKEESIDAILEMAEHKRTGKCRLLLVTGCLAQRYGSDLLRDMPEIDGLLGVGEYERIFELIDAAALGARPRYDGRTEGFLESDRVLSTPPCTAYIKIGDGCDNRCTYCAIPLIRGGYRSRPLDAIVAEVTRLAARGVQEFVLVAQDSTRYASDWGQPRGLEALLRAVCAVPGVVWVRPLYCDPERVDAALLDAMHALPQVCDYMDMPIQHIHPELLRAMGRRGTSSHIREMVTAAHSRGMTLRTSLIVGFPGETDAQFQALMDFVAEARFHRLGAFAYSPEEDTPAALLPGQVPDAVKRQRLDTLMALQQRISLAHNQARVGQVCRVLVEGARPDGRRLGRTEREAPEVDGRIIFRPRQPHAIGDFVSVRLQRAASYDMMGVEV